MPSNPAVELQLGDSTDYPELKFRGMTIATVLPLEKSVYEAKVAGAHNASIYSLSNKPHTFTSTKASLVCSI